MAHRTDDIYIYTHSEINFSGDKDVVEREALN